MRREDCAGSVLLYGNLSILAIFLAAEPRKITESYPFAKKPDLPGVFAEWLADCQMLSSRHPTRSFIFGYSRLLRHLYVTDCGRDHAISNAICKTGPELTNFKKRMLN